MELTREGAKVVIGGIIGAGLGVVFGGMTAAAAVHGDSSIRSGHGGGAVFLLSFAGWTLSSVAIGYLWKYARDNRSANWVGIISATPLAITSLVVASPRSELLSVSELVVFVVGDVIVGVVVAQAGIRQFGLFAAAPGADASPRSQ